MKNMEKIAEQLEGIARAEQGPMLAFLEGIVNRESGSFDTEDVNALGEYLSEVCRRLGAEVTRKASEIHGDPIACTFNCPEADTRRILLVCHRDTVFPHGTVAVRPFSQDDEKCYGPGCSDMKGGITTGIHAIKALATLKDLAGSVPLEIIFTSDEEIGSEASAGFVAERAKHAKAAFYLEPARANGALVTGRDGGDLIVFEAFGKSSHAGNAFADGVSAIHGLARVVTRLSALTDDPAGYSTNVGLIDGGEGAIIVAEHARAKVYTRFSTLEQREYLLTNFRKICEEESRAGLRIVMHEPVGFLPFLPNAANQSLFSLVRRAGGAFGLDLSGMNVRGAADAGITSCLGIPTICGMGPVGGNLHTEREYGIKATLSERMKVLALSILLANEAYA